MTPFAAGLTSVFRELAAVNQNSLLALSILAQSSHDYALSEHFPPMSNSRGILHCRTRENYRFFYLQARRGRRSPPKAWRQLGLFHRVTHFKVIGLVLMSQHGLLDIHQRTRSYAMRRSSSIVRTRMCRDFKSCDGYSALLCRY